MGTTRDDGSQQSMWVATADLPQGGGHPFYERPNQILSAAGFYAFVEPSSGHPLQCDSVFVRHCIGASRAQVVRS